MAASTESMRNASNIAAEKILQLGTSNIYKKAVRVRNSFATMQFLLREKVAAKRIGEAFVALEQKPVDAKVKNEELTLDNAPTSSEDFLNHFMGDIGKGERELPSVKEFHFEAITSHVSNQDGDVTTKIQTKSPLAIGNIVKDKEEPDFTQDSSYFPNKQHGRANDDPLNQMPECSNATPLRNVVGFDLVKLDKEQKRLFKLQHKVRETLRRTREQEESLKSREAILHEKEIRVKRFADCLKKQELQLSCQLKKHQEADKISTNFSDNEHSLSEKNEFIQVRLKEREERILRLERKLQKLQLRLRKKQQDYDLSVALHHVTPGIDENRYCCRSMQTDSMADLVVQDSRAASVSRPTTLKFEPFLFCNDANVLYTHAKEEPGFHVKVAAAKKCKAKISRRWQQVAIQRRNHHSFEKNRQGSIYQKSSHNMSGVNVHYNREVSKVENTNPQIIQSEEVMPINSLDSKTLEQRSLLPCAIPEATMHRDVVSVATKAEAASVYRNYKFSFDLGACLVQNTVFPSRKTSKLTIVQEGAVSSCSHMLEKIDQQIQGALNNI